MFRFMCILSLSLTIQQLTANWAITMLQTRNGTNQTNGPRSMNLKEAMQHCKARDKQLPSNIGLREETILLNIMNQSGVTSIWLGMVLKDLPEWTWIGETGEPIGPVDSNVYRIIRGAQCCKLTENGLYNTRCSTEIDGYICHSDCIDCKAPDCITVDGRCFYIKCHDHIDWYSAFMNCKTQKSGLATEIGPIRLPTKCSDRSNELWVGCVKDQWLTAEENGSAVLNFRWRPGKIHDSKGCAVLTTDAGTPGWETADCGSEHPTLCMNPSTESTKANGVPDIWIFILIGLAFAVVLTVAVTISVYIWDNYRTRKTYYTDAVSLTAVHQAGSSFAPATPTGQPLPYPSTSDLARTASYSTLFDSCLECGQNDDNDSIHYDNMVFGDVLRCKSCGRPVAPDRPPPRIPRRAGKPSIEGSQTRPKPLPGVEEDYENPVADAKIYQRSGRGQPGGDDQVNHVIVTPRSRARKSNAV